MTTQEIKIKALRLIEATIILKTNVFNGCYSDKSQLEANMERMPKIKEWAKENNMLQDINHWLGSGKFNGHLQFSANDLSSFFNN